MSDKVEHILHATTKDIYKIGEGENALTFSISTGETTYTRGPSFLGPALTLPTNFVELNLSRNGVTLYNILQKADDDDNINGGTGGSFDINIAIADKLYDDQTEEGLEVKRFLNQIKENPLVDKIRESIEDTPNRRKRMAKWHEKIEAMRRIIWKHKKDKLFGKVNE